MLKRYIVPLAATFFLVAQSAVAQPVIRPLPQRLPFSQPASRLLSLFDDYRGEVQLHGIRGPREVTVGERVAFTVAANLESADLPLKCQWNFGDGTTTFELVGVHTFTKPGKYRVICTLGNHISEDIEAFDVHVYTAEKRPVIQPVSTPDGLRNERTEAGL